MSTLPHVKLGDRVTAELRDIFHAYCREHGPLPAPATVMTATNVNKAIDWWNGLEREAEAEKLAEAVAQAWHYPDTGEGES